MKNKKLLIKIFIVGGFLLFLLLLVIVFSLVRIFIPKDQNGNTKDIISQTYSLDNIKNISFDFKKSNVVFKISNNQDLIIVQNSKEDKFYLNYERKGDMLYFEEDGYLLNPQKKKYTIYFPQNYMNTITIINGFGEVDVAGIKNIVEINNNSGVISLKETGDVKLVNVSGDISFKNITGNIDASSSTGNITIENITGALNIETITGNIKVTRFNVTGDSNIESVSGDIILKINEKSACGIKNSNETGKTKIDKSICANDYNIINVKNVAGLINIY